MYYSGKNLLSVSNVSFAVNPQRMVLSVVENPVILFPMLVIVPEEIDG